MPAMRISNIPEIVKSPSAYIWLMIWSLIFIPTYLKCQIKPFQKQAALTKEVLIGNSKDAQLKQFVIRANHHSPENRRAIFQTSREFTIISMFDPSCLYSFPDSHDRLAINKIFGYSFGFNPHFNSFRIGWRCRDTLIEILAYWYIGHQRHDSLLFCTEPGKRFFINVKLDVEKAMIRYQVEDMPYEIQEVCYNPERFHLKKWGYVNYPYFGGLRKAPHDMKLYLHAWIF
jgi:hypothetical protein